LRYALTGQTPDEVPAEDLARILAYRGAGDLFVDLLERYATVSGISGIQPKVLVRAEEVDLPRARHRGATHIIKSFDPREYPELAANEYFCLRAAHHAGIPTPNVRLSDNRRVLVVTRFDRRADGTYAEIRDHIAEHDDFTAAGEHLVTAFERGLRRSIVST
jgi:serine/threonine-protein kinase HipA